MSWDEIKEIEKEDFVFLGNHSHSHEYLIDYNFINFKKDIDRSINIFKKILVIILYFFLILLENIPLNKKIILLKILSLHLDNNQV